MNKIKLAFVWIAETHIGKITLASLLLIIFGTLYNFWEWAKWPMFASITVLLGYYLVLMYHATINFVNDTRDWWERRKK